MLTDIYIVSGFLGAGKTTLIQKLLKETFKNEKVVIIENDFGEANIDASLLKPSGVQVREINSGCICCSLSGDFVKAVKELLEQYKPTKIIVEPSGVSKLSDVVKGFQDSKIKPFAKVKSKITVVDVKRCQMYVDNFGEFFEDQIINADVILLSRTEEFPDKVEKAKQLIDNLNSHLVVLSRPWNKISANDIINESYNEKNNNLEDNCYNDKCNHDHHHNNCDHDHHHNNCDHDHHHHTAEDSFDTVTIKIKKPVSIDELKNKVQKMEKSSKGTILRAKGIVPTKNGYLSLQYVPEKVEIKNSTCSGEIICIIGHNLDKNELINIYNGR